MKKKKYEDYKKTYQTAGMNRCAVIKAYDITSHHERKNVRVYNVYLRPTITH